MPSRPLRGDFMIVASSGRYLPISGHDNEPGRVGGFDAPGGLG